MQTIYIERGVKDHPQTKAIIQRFGSQKTIIECDHYREIFNRKSQNFRLQKQNPALILAKKPKSRVLPTPPGFGIGGQHNYYFSHLLNCPYDCRYCFLQGMYQSAHYVLFVNYEDFQQDIIHLLEQHPDEESITFFSGYDADSLALESITQFIDIFIPFFSQQPRALLELRTKSMSINSLLQHQAIPNVVVAFSFTPDRVSQHIEHRVPAVKRRIAAMRQLQEAGWRLGLRFDPLIYSDDFEAQYDELLTDIFKELDPAAIHSVSTGLLRFPDRMYQKISSLYPKDVLLAHPMEQRQKTMSYSKDRERVMLDFVHHKINQFVPDSLIFKCSLD